MHTHSNRLERWLGTSAVEQISSSMRDWYGPPILLSQVPGHIYAMKGGDFCGAIRGGYFANVADYYADKAKKVLKSASRKQLLTCNTGFSSLSDMISEATAGGKRREFFFHKIGVTGAAQATNTLWYVGDQPAAGGNAAAAPGGTVPDSTSTGAFSFDNPTGGDTQHFVTGYPIASVSGNALLLYDRLFSVTKTMSSLATEAVSGVPTRYTSQTSTDQNYIGGNFLMIECRTALSATAHTWTTCLYTDQGGASSTLPSVTGNSSNIQYRLDQPLNTWFCPLETGDVGIKALTQMQCSSNAVTGAIDFTIGHPIAWMPCPVLNMACVVDGINTAFNLVRIFDGACLAFLEVTKLSTTATTYTGSFVTLRG